MTGFVDSTVKDIDGRLKELQEEVSKLEAARAALVGPARRGPGRPPRSAASSAAAEKPAARRGRRPGRPRGRRGGNTRSNQALELIRSQPGITIPQIAESLKIEPNYLYRVIPKLINEGLVSREGKGYHGAAAAE